VLAQRVWRMNARLATGVSEAAIRRDRSLVYQATKEKRKLNNSPAALLKNAGAENLNGAAEARMARSGSSSIVNLNHHQ